MLSIRYFAYYIIFGINTGSIMPPPWVRRTWGRIARIWVPKSSSTRAGGLPKLGAAPVPAGMAQTPATTVAAVAQGTPPTVVPFNQLQPDLGLGVWSHRRTVPSLWPQRRTPLRCAAVVLG